MIAMPKAVKTKHESILGPKAREYTTRSAQNGHILDIPAEGVLELYPAGFTKPVGKGQWKGTNRQAVYRTIYETALNLQKEGQDFPFGKGSGHYVELEPEESNPHDPNAISVVLYADQGHPLHHLDGADLGYIPMRISDVVKANLRMFRHGKIVYVRNMVHKRHYGARVRLYYGDQCLPKSKSLLSKRFRAIMEE